MTPRVLTRQRSRETGHRRGGGHVIPEAETGVRRPRAEHVGSRSQLEEATEGSPAEPPEGARPAEASDSFQPRETNSQSQRMSFCCSEPPGFWKFVTGAIGNHRRGRQRLEKGRWFHVPTTDFISPNSVLQL